MQAYVNDDGVCGVFGLEVNENEERVISLHWEVEKTCRHCLWRRLVMSEIAEVSEMG